jgi:ribonuclease HI
VYIHQIKASWNLGFEQWLPKWRRNGFKTANGDPVKNVPLIRYISALLDQRAMSGQKVRIVTDIDSRANPYEKVRIQHVRGHTGEEGNEGADLLANQGCGLATVVERDWEAMESEIRADLEAGSYK